MPKTFDDYGTKVKYRSRYSEDVKGKQFFGKTHADEANKFVSENKASWDFFRIIPIGKH